MNASEVILDVWKCDMDFDFRLEKSYATPVILSLSVG